MFTSKDKGSIMKKYEIIIEGGSSWGVFDTKEKAYDFAVNQIHTLKLMCGDIYIPYEIKEVLL